MLEDNLKIGLTFDDVLLVPAKSDVLPGEVDVSTWLTKNIRINIPLASAAMDTVTEAELAIAIAREGGIGIIHRALSIEEQKEEVAKVKRSESIVISEPKSILKTETVKDAQELMEKHQISGILVIEDNLIEPILAGIVTARDLKFETCLNRPVKEVMTVEVITAREGITTDNAKEIMRKNKIEKLPLINESGWLCGLITLKDIEKSEKYPNACKDKKGKLRVGAAIGVGKDAIRRAEELIKAGVDLIAIDTAHGHSARVIATVEELRDKFPELEIIAGNVATAEATEDLIKAGASAVKVGVGPGSICTTRIIAGVGVPQITAIKECSETAREFDIPIIADGGIQYSGDVTKAIAAGASSVMIGSLFAGTEESPGETVLFQGRTYKTYRGMGSLGAMQANNGESRDRYGQEGTESKKLVPEGVEGRVPYKGLLAASVHQLVGGLRSGMGYCGARNIEALQKNSRFIRITPAGLKESHVHDVTVTREAPNYSEERT